VPIPAAGAPIDAEMLDEISGGDAAVGREFLGRFGEFNRNDVSLLRKAVEHRDLAQMRRIAHRMKGASRTVGANPLGNACELLERAVRGGDWDRVLSTMSLVEGEIARLEAYLA
jgi:HPt (histidine-containing phosphotransfer) domain-containing protein